MSEARPCILQLRTRLGSVNKHGGRWALGPRNTSRALGLQSPVVLRVDDLGEQLLSLVTAVTRKCHRIPRSSWGWQTLQRAGPLGASSSWRAPRTEGMRRDHDLAFHCTFSEIFLMYIVFLETEIVVQGHRCNSAGCRMRLFCPFHSCLPTR